MASLAARCTALAALLLLSTAAAGGERQAASFYRALRGERLEAFLRAFPKGGELHTHLTGAVSPEKLIEIAGRRAFCFDPKAVVLVQNRAEACPAGQTPAAEIRAGDETYRRLVDAMSMRGNRGGPQAGHDHFFQAFRFRVLFPAEVLGDLMEDVVARAAAQNIGYLEMMFYPFPVGQRNDLVLLLGRGESLATWYETLEKEAAFERFVAEGAAAVARMESELAARLSPDAAAVERRYIVNVGRTREPATVFVQLAAAAALVGRDPRVVGLNLVGAEDNPVARRDFRLHMRMLDLLAARRPQIRVSLHAGELAPRLLAREKTAGTRPASPAGYPPGLPHEDLTFHIAESVWQGRAERIGHGSSLRYERDHEALLRAMRERGVLVEIALTSEEIILGLRGREVPFEIYRKHGVPVALSTDDEGIFGADLTREFLRAARDYRLDYRALKELARNSIHYSFLPGRSLFRSRDYRQWVPACSAEQSPACREYLENNPRAAAQLRLEQRFAQFEAAESLQRFGATEETTRAQRHKVRKR